MMTAAAAPFLPPATMTSPTQSFRLWGTEIHTGCLFGAPAAHIVPLALAVESVFHMPHVPSYTVLLVPYFWYLKADRHEATLSRNYCMQPCYVTYAMSNHDVQRLHGNRCTLRLRGKVAPCLSAFISGTRVSSAICTVVHSISGILHCISNANALCHLYGTSSTELLVSYTVFLMLSATCTVLTVP